MTRPTRLNDARRVPAVGHNLRRVWLECGWDLGTRKIPHGEARGQGQGQEPRGTPVNVDEPGKREAGEKALTQRLRASCRRRKKAPPR